MLDSHAGSSRRAWLRCEGVQPVIVKPLRKDRKGGARSLLLADVDVELRVGVEVFRSVVTLERGQTIYRISFVAILERLGEGNTVLHNRTREGDPWREGRESHN